MTVVNLSQSKAEAFMQNVVGILNNATLALMISVGHRTGLFDTMSELPPSTSEEIAKAANLNERYVREWLGAMVTGRIVEYRHTSNKYLLPPEHAACLTRAATPNNLATTAQFVPILGSIEDQIVECFRKGGGVPYSAYPRFQEVMAEESNQSTVSALIDSILPLAPGLVESLREGIEVLDIGCGSGRALNIMAWAFPNSRFTGYDFSEEGVEAGRAEAARLGLSNIRFEVKDVSELDEVEWYGLITAFDAIHDQANPRKVLNGIARSLRPDGIFLMQDIGGSSHVHKNLDNPMAPWLYTISCLHCMTVSLAMDGEGLGAMWGEEKARQLLAEAGFTRVQVRQLPHDMINYYYIATKN